MADRFFMSLVAWREIKTHSALVERLWQSPWLTERPGLRRSFVIARVS